MKKRPEKGRALSYTRDSGGKHENTPGEYVNWARKEAAERGLNFNGTPELIDEMIRQGEFARGDLFVDYDVKGNTMSRRALDACKAEAFRDLSVSHILIPRRDRLARPDSPLDGIRLELLFREAGITLVFMDRVCPPLPKRGRQDVGELIVSLIDYETAGAFRLQLADKILRAQLTLARLGYSTGGRPPFGFRRWLVSCDGKRVRQLMDGERVRMAGHHVVWLPGPETELNLICRILEMLETMAATAVARLLNAEGIPSPDAGRERTDNGVKHLVSGKWNSTTIGNIARNKLLVAVASYGRRSMGDQLRFTPEGPRQLTEEDLRTDEAPKVVRNADSELIKADAKFEPLFDPERFEKLQKILDKRAGSQRGKTRSRDASKNPLGGRVFDINCGWLMYRVPYNGSYRHTCGLYQQTHGGDCAHNHVDGPKAIRFAVNCIRQQILSPSQLAKVKRVLRELAAKDVQYATCDGRKAEMLSALQTIEQELKLATENLARATSDEAYAAIEARFNALVGRKQSLQSDIQRLSQKQQTELMPEQEIERALSFAGSLRDLIEDPAHLPNIRQALDVVNARLFFRFGTEQRGKRTCTRALGGVVTFGDTAPPVKIYEGPTSRSKLKANGPETANTVAGPVGRCSPNQPDGSGREDESLGNQNRGDRI